MQLAQEPQAGPKLTRCATSDASAGGAIDTPRIDPLLKAAAQDRQWPAQNKIEGGDHGIDDHRLEGHLAHQFDEADDRGDGRALYQLYEKPDRRRYRYPHRLRQDDKPELQRVAEAEAFAGFRSRRSILDVNRNLYIAGIVGNNYLTLPETMTIYTLSSQYSRKLIDVLFSGDLRPPLLPKFVKARRLQL
jgi:hypothetical protein